MQAGSVVRAKVVVTESFDEGERVFASPGDRGEVLEVFEGGTAMIAWPGGVAECDASEFDAEVEDAHLTDGRTAEA